MASLVLNNWAKIMMVQSLQMLVNFLGISVTFQEPTENSHSSDPDDLLWHSGIGCSFSLAMTHMTSLPASDGMLTYPCP